MLILVNVFHFKPIKSLIKTFYNSHYMSCMSNISSPNWNALKEPKSKLSTYTYNYTQWTRKTTLLKVQFWKVSLIVRWKTTLFWQQSQGKKIQICTHFYYTNFSVSNSLCLVETTTATWAMFSLSVAVTSRQMLRT